jgi:hypothetical protein
LLLEKEVFGNDSLYATGAKEFRDGSQQVDQENDYVLHSGEV